MKGVLVSAVCLWAAGGCQQAVTHKIAIFGITPDFLLITLGCLALFGTRKSGAVCGFFAGLIQGALSGANMAQYVVSRTVVGFLAGWFGAFELEANAVVAFFAVAVSTLLGQALLMFTAPPSHLVGFLLATIGTAMYNGVLAMPLFMVLRRVVDPPSR